MIQNNTISCNDASEIYSMYYQYRDSLKNEIYLKNCVEHSLRTLGDSKKEIINNIQKLNITLPIDKIKDIFNKTGLIQLREADTSKKLLVGCGNGQIGDGGCKSKHDGYITINPEIEMNPTIVGAFGHDDNLNLILKEGFFEEFHSECVTLGSTFSELSKNTFKPMIKGFKIYEITSDVPRRVTDLVRSDLFLHNEDEKTPTSPQWDNKEEYPPTPISPAWDSSPWYSSSEEEIK